MTRAKMREILEEMVQYGEHDDITKMTELRRSYDSLAQTVYQSPPAPLDLQYEECKSLLNMFIDDSIFVGDKQILLEAAEAVDKLPKPENVSKMMYELLEKMVKGVQQGDKAGVLKLNEIYDAWAAEARESEIQLDPRYDQCRTSCVMYASESAIGDPEEFKAHAINTFEELSKPEKQPTS